MSKHYKVSANERVFPKMRGYRMSCCDCGLVHVIDFHAVKVKKKNPDGSWEYVDLNPDKYRVVFSADRCNRGTAQVRRWRKSDSES